MTWRRRNSMPLIQLITHRNCGVPTETKADIIDPLPRNLPTSSLSVIIVRSEYSTHDKSMTRLDKTQRIGYSIYLIHHSYRCSTTDIATYGD